MENKNNIVLTTTTYDENLHFTFIDSKDLYLKERRIQRLLNRYRSYFIDLEQYILRNDLSYLQILEIVDKLNYQLTKLDLNKVLVDKEIDEYINQSKYEMEEHLIAGITIKDFDSRWEDEVNKFLNIINDEISRPLLPKQVQSSFYLATMKRAGNFSVPGSGKTAMMYGAYAYLSSKKINEVDKILVVCPLNAFEAWRSEYVEVFGDKRNLMFLNLRDPKYNDYGKIKLDWGIADVVIINYESLASRLNVLNELIDRKTMLVFDEVHRVKGVGKQRASAALALGEKTHYRYVLTGTPIPNRYSDIYNFLNILYGNEYDTFFGWSPNELFDPDPNEVNEKLKPFFWRTNKKDLNVPDADDDIKLKVTPSEQQKLLVETIYQNEFNILALYTRLLQASTNPSLLLKRIDYYSMGFTEEEIQELDIDSALTDEEVEIAKMKAYENLDVKNMESTKFNEGIELILDLVNDGKKVLVWGIFVGTMHKIASELERNGVNSILIYGETPKEDRVDMINEFRDGDVQVLVSNPHTLGEAISLHQTVHDAVYFEYNFNLTFMLQSRDRIHRLGLEEDQYTRYYYMMTEGNKSEGGYIDEHVYNRLKEKEDVMIEAIDGNFLVPEIETTLLDDIKSIIKI